jgi:hypothetical protein
MKKIILVSIIIICLPLIFGFTMSNELSVPKEPKECFVPNEKTAIMVAEAIWLPIFGDDIYKYKPFKAKLIDGRTWKVYGTVHTAKGGSPFAIIQMSDCKIIKVYHEK